MRKPVVVLAAITKSIVLVPLENRTNGSSLGIEAFDVNASITVPASAAEDGDDNASDISNDFVGFTISGTPASDNAIGGGATGASAMVTLRVRASVRGLPSPRLSDTRTVKPVR